MILDWKEYLKSAGRFAGDGGFGMLHQGVSASDAGGGDICFGTVLADKGPVGVNPPLGGIEANISPFVGRIPCPAAITVCWANLAWCRS